MKKNIKILLNITLESGKIEVTDISLVEGKMTGEVSSFLDVLRDSIEGMSEGEPF